VDDVCYTLETTHLNTLTSFQLVNDTQRPNTTYFAYSLDTAIAKDAYHSVPTGSLAAQNNTYEIISWGYDSLGAAFIIVYETPAASQTKASLDIFSRDPSGPSKDTLDAIKSGIKSFGNQQLIDLLKDVTKTPQDGGRSNDPWPSCNATCRTNGKFTCFTLLHTSAIHADISQYTPYPFSRVAKRTYPGPSRGQKKIDVNEGDFTYFCKTEGGTSTQ